MENQQNQVQGPVKNNDSYLLVTIMWITNIIGGVGFWIALILFFVKKDDFVVRDACRKYLNLCILYILAFIALIVLAVVLLEQYLRKAISRFLELSIRTLRLLQHWDTLQ